MVFKTSDETIFSDVVLSDDAELTFPVDANTNYIFRLGFFWNTPVAADFKFSVTCPAAATLFRLAGDRGIENGLGTQYFFDASGDVESPLGTAADGRCIGEGILQNGVNAGNVIFQWCQNTSNAGNTTVYAGSYIEYIVIP
jgi:hypothetical protein